MRFDTPIELITTVMVEDDMGGRVLTDKVLYSLNASVDELSVIETYKIYGVATTDSVKARVLGHIEEKIDKIKYNNKMYKVIAKRYVNNKTSFLLEVLDDGH